MRKMMALIWSLLYLCLLPNAVQAYNQVGGIEPEKPSQIRTIDNSGSFQTAVEDRYQFSGISGPHEKTMVRAAGQQSWARYSQGGRNAMAVLVTDDKSDWLGLAHGLKSIGVPFVLTRDYREALQHRALMVYPALSGGNLSAEAVAALAVHARTGGTLLAVQPMGLLSSLIGYTEAIPSRQHTSVQFQAGSQPFLPADQRETFISLRGEQSKDLFGCYSFLFPQGQVVASYEDGSAAIIKRQYGAGAAYAIGMDIGHWLLNGYNNRAESSARSYVNEYEPTLDVLLQWLKMIYQKAESNAVTLGTVPKGKKLSLLLTHDLDYGQSTINALTYAEFEKSMGIRGTYFVQTKYVRDFYDDVFFNETYVPYIKTLLKQGMEVGSHTVSHSRVFSYLPLGSGEESYPSYLPSISGFYSIHNATVLGEIRVSKYLLEKTANAGILSFRAGHLQNPRSLPEALESCGYRYSSNVTANSSLTHLPFQLTYGRDNGDEVDVYEFPITVEDELDSPMEARLDKAILLGKKLSRYGGTMNVLIHPNVLGGKLVFEQGLVAAFRDTAWFGSVTDYGRWWAARDQVTLDVTAEGNLRNLKLNVPLALDGLTLQVPSAWKLQSANASQQGQQVLVDCASGETALVFQLQ